MKIKEYLEKNRISPMEFALAIGVSMSTMYAYFKGRQPHRSTAYRIEKVTNGKITVEELMGETK